MAAGVDKQALGSGWTEFADSIETSVVVQNCSAVDIVVRIAAEAPASTVMGGIIIRASEREEFKGEAGDKLYARKRELVPGSADCYVWG